MKLKNLFLGLGLTLAVGASALIGGISTSKEIRGASAHSTTDLTKITAENSADFVGATAYVIGSDTAFGLSTSGKLANGGTLLALTIEEGTSGNSIVLKRNDNNKYLSDPTSGSWADSSVTRYLQTSNGALSRDNDTEHYYWRCWYGDMYAIEVHQNNSSGSLRSLFYVYAEPLPEPEPVVLSLKVNDNWASDGARFAAYFFDGGDPTWVDMTLVSGSTRLYEVTVPDGYTSVIFCRMYGDRPANSWDNKMNQTGNLSVSDGDYFLMKEGSWDSDLGNWHDGQDDVYVEGDFTPEPWTAHDDCKLTWNRLSGQYEAQGFIYISQGNKFKVCDTTTSVWAGWQDEGMTNNYDLFSADGSNIVANTYDVYDIYFKPFNGVIWIEENATLAADHFAIGFLTTTGLACKDSSQGQGDTDLDDLSGYWGQLVTTWNGLSVGAKGVFAEGTATANIIEANARYVHIMSRYSETLTPFVDGPVYTPSSAHTIIGGFNSNSMLIVVVIATISLAAISGMIIVKKKHQ